MQDIVQAKAEKFYHFGSELLVDAIQEWTSTKMSICVYDSKTLDENLMASDLIIEILQQPKQCVGKGYELGIQCNGEKSVRANVEFLNKELSYTPEQFTQLKKKLLMFKGYKRDFMVGKAVLVYDLDKKTLQIVSRR